MNPLVRGLFEQFIEAEELTAISEDDAFELFAASLALPSGVITQAPLTDFRLDPGTPGVDVVVLAINGQLVRDADDMHEIAKESARLDVEVQMLQAKRATSIDTAQLLNVGDIATRILNGDNFADYPTLNQLTQAIAELYRHYAPKLTKSPSVEVRFVTSANSSAVNAPEVEQRRSSVKMSLALLGHLGDVSVEVWGSDNLHSAWQKRNNANQVDITLSKQLNLPGMPGIDQAILGIASLTELFRMLVGTDGTLDERVFYDNVRGFQGTSNRVNNRIIETATGDQGDLLPVLNNGITIVAEKYSPLPGDSMSLSGYQIVNGCQTSHCLYLAGQQITPDRASKIFVPVRVVVTTDEQVKSQIILATNSQTEVDETQLVALTAFQKRLEDYYRLDPAGIGLHYERRPGQYHDRAIPKTRIVSIQDQLRCLSAVALKLPHVAARYPNRLFEEVKDDAFVDGHQLQPYVASALAAYRLENAFRTGLEASFKPARYHILMAYSIQALGHPFSPLNSRKAEEDAKNLIKRLNQPDQPELFRKAGELIVSVAGGTMPTRDRLKGRQFTTEIVSALVRSGT